VANSIDISWFFQGLEEFKKTVVRNAIVKIISVILIFTLVKTKNDLSNYFLIYVISNLLGNLTLWLSLPKYVQRIKFKELKILKHLKPTIGLFIPQIAVQIYTVLDKTMIGAIVTDKSEVGFYEQAQKIVKILMTIATSLGTVMVPRMANTYASGDKEKLKEYMEKSFRFVLFLAFPLMFGIISVVNKFVPIFYGPGYDKVIYLISIISPIIVIIGLSNVIGTQYLLPTKRQKEFTISVTIGAIVNLILNSILIRLYKSIGASIATVAAELTVTSIQFYLVRKEINIKNVFKIASKYCLSAIIMFGCSFGIGLVFTNLLPASFNLFNFTISNNLISIIVQMLLGCIIYFAMLLITKDELIFEGIEMIKRKICKQNNI
jgi:O-antigen/teichoic acid export membrane protein